MKSRSEIWLCALDELGAQCSVSTQRDAETLAARVAQEGDSFLLSTLPRFAKDLELALAARRITPGLFDGFSREKFKVDVTDVFRTSTLYTVNKPGGLPKFLGGFLDLVFTRRLQVTETEFQIYSGTPAEALLHIPRLREAGPKMLQMADAIAAIRQLCLMFGKEKEHCSDSIVEVAFRTFAETDRELDLPLWTSGPTPSSEEIGSLILGGWSD